MLMEQQCGSAGDVFSTVFGKQKMTPRNKSLFQELWRILLLFCSLEMTSCLFCVCFCGKPKKSNSSVTRRLSGDVTRTPR